MIIFSLLLITISGINAFARLDGDQYTFSYNERDSKFNYLGTIFGIEPKYHYNKFYITRELGYTSWDKFLEDYKYADFDGRIHIEFSRLDKEGKTFDVRVFPNQIELSKVRLSKYGPMFEGTDPVFYVYPNPVSVEKAMVLPGKEYAFHKYDQVIFDETIWVGLSRLHAEVHVSLEGYTKDNQLILAAVYKLECSQYLSSSGMDFKMTGHNPIILRRRN